MKITKSIITGFADDLIIFVASDGIQTHCVHVQVHCKDDLGSDYDTTRLGDISALDDDDPIYVVTTSGAIMIPPTSPAFKALPLGRKAFSHASSAIDFARNLADQCFSVWSGSNPADAELIGNL